MSTQLVTYGGATLPYSSVQCRQVLVYDTDDRTVLGTQYEFTISGWITATTVDTFQTNLITIKEKVFQARQPLVIKDQDESVDLFRYEPGTNVHDWGPKTRRFDTVELKGMRSARYSWVVEVFVNECGSFFFGPPPLATGVLSITRTYTFSVDLIGLVTRSVSGSLKVASTHSPADSFRTYIIPPLPNNFRRIQQQFSQSPDGRTLTYSVVDQEVIYTLPIMVGDGEANWSVRIADHGARVYYNLSGRYRAPVTTPKVQMFQYLLDLINQRFPLNEQTLIFTEAQVTDAVYDNEIRFSISADGPVGKAADGLPAFESVFRRMSLSPPNSTGESYFVPPYGANAGVGHIAKDPPIHKACQGSESPEDQNPQLTSELREYSPWTPYNEEDVVENSGISFEHQTTPFVAYHERISYELINNVVMFTPKNPSAVYQTIRQQTCPSELHIIQAGYFTCYAIKAQDVPRPPSPILTDSTILSANIEPHVPEPVGDGSWNTYTVHWRYVSRYNHGIVASLPLSDRIMFPIDKRRAEPEVEPPWNDLGDLQLLQGQTE